MGYLELITTRVARYVEATGIPALALGNNTVRLRHLTGWAEIGYVEVA